VAHPAGGAAPAPSSQPLTESDSTAGRPHLVVVRTHVAESDDGSAAGTALVARYWHPRDHRWNEHTFESLDHAIRLFVDESGWVLRQQQDLDGPAAHELVFEARRADFARPSTEQILRDVGMTPDSVADLLDRVDRGDPPAASP
jgi:hypothetical protein